MHHSGVQASVIQTRPICDALPPLVDHDFVDWGCIQPVWEKRMMASKEEDVANCDVSNSI